MSTPLRNIVFYLMLIFMLMIGSVRTRSYDDGELEEVLAPAEDCWLPCWNNILPGRTPVREAERILTAYPGARSIGQRFRAASGQIHWKWAVLAPAQRSIAQPSYVQVDDGRVTRIYLAGFRAYADLWLRLGPPSAVEIYRNVQHDPNRLIYLSVYEDEVYVESQIACNTGRADLWGALSAVIIGKPPSYPGAWRTVYLNLTNWMPEHVC